ncbi:hypothetical protein OIU77_001772 [Salix suchowensis]|uniref:Starch synthase catalytic domain-containing protein n=1 Tax=Salix suchowensis TaxID=1278906 RepID=A0ABQ9B2R0_9ROSI|nr:hypothetical protein OIU77_001772 [Salix suchowensis]
MHHAPLARRNDPEVSENEVNTPSSDIPLAQVASKMLQVFKLNKTWSTEEKDSGGDAIPFPDMKQYSPLIDSSNPLAVEREFITDRSREEDSQDPFYKKYTERMRWFDVLNHERTSEISVILNRQAGNIPGSIFESMKLPADMSVPKMERRLWKSLESDFELVYVAQSCLSWEALHHQYRKVEALASSSSQNGVFYDDVAGEFQKFQVLLERFVEDEMCESGKRNWNYVRARFSLRSLLQVPVVSGFHEQENEEIKREAIHVKEVMEAIERSILAYWEFIKTDGRKTWWKSIMRSSLWTWPTVENPRDLWLQADLTRKLQRKELWLKESPGKLRRWLRRAVEPTLEESQKKEMLFTMIDLKLVSRVLQMSVLSTSQLKWCQEKLDDIAFTEGKIARACTGGPLTKKSHNLAVFNNGFSLRFKPVRATAEEGASGDESEDKLQATIEKSKKVLAMQRDLLQQIAERRKMVSSIKSSIVDSEVDEVPSEQSENSSPNQDHTSSSGEGVHEKQNGSILWKNYVHSTADEVPETSSLDISKGHDDDKRELEQQLPPEKASSHEDSSIPLEVTGSENVCLPPPLAGANVMNVIVVAAECAPWSKTGGLGDVAGSLPKALARRGHRVMVVAPRYGNYAEPQDIGVRKRYKVDGQDIEVTYFQTYIDGVDFVFIESHLFRHIEGDIYGGSRLDILKRMMLFCKAAVEVPWYVPCGGVCYGDGNLVFIANDWHTALLPVYLKAYYRDNGLMEFTRSILVIHNIAHQGRGPVDDFLHVDLPGHYIDLFKLHDPVGGEHFNIFAAGLKAADRVVTVSHGYSWELKTSEGGWGLHNIIKENDWKFSGIVNGIDTKEWNPLFDVHLTSDDVPLIGFIGRLDQQKGVDLIAEAVPWMMDQDVQLVMLGTGRQDLEKMLRQFENQYHDKIRGWVGFSVKMAHRITAGSDILLMPSRFEPCGLNQLYAMMYGTVPVVHAVGGLRDTETVYGLTENTRTVGRGSKDEGWLRISAGIMRLRNTRKYSSLPSTSGECLSLWLDRFAENKAGSRVDLSCANKFPCTYLS